MSEYDEEVENQRVKLEAIEWAGKVRSIHAHSLTSLWYETNPEDFEQGGVVDIEYNSGVIERTLKDGTQRTIGKQLTEEEIVNEYTRNT